MGEQIRKFARTNDVFLWQVAEKLGISEPTLTRWLRGKIPDERRAAIERAIVDLASEKEVNL